MLLLVLLLLLRKLLLLELLLLGKFRLLLEGKVSALLLRVGLARAVVTRLNSRCCRLLRLHGCWGR